MVRFATLKWPLGGICLVAMGFCASCLGPLEYVNKNSVIFNESGREVIVKLEFSKANFRASWNGGSMSPGDQALIAVECTGFGGDDVSVLTVRATVSGSQTDSTSYELDLQCPDFQAFQLNIESDDQGVLRIANRP